MTQLKSNKKFMKIGIVGNLLGGSFIPDRVDDKYSPKHFVIFCFFKDFLTRWCERKGAILELGDTHKIPIIGEWLVTLIYKP